MKLYTRDNMELMNITSIKSEGRNLVVEGTIMGAMPVCAIVKPAEVRAAMKLMSPGDMFAAFTMLFRGSR